MSASPIARAATQSQAIPTKRVQITDPSQMPSDYSSTPGGTLYSTTPGGTRIVYERSTLMFLKNSPLSQTPPKHLNDFPSSLCKNGAGRKIENCVKRSPPRKASLADDHEQFEIDI